MDRKLIILIALSLILGLLLSHSAAARPMVLNPVLPLPAEMGPLPMLESALRDPLVAKTMPHDGVDAERAQSEFTALESSLSAMPAGPARVQKLREAMLLQAGILAYAEDLSLGLSDHLEQSASAPVDLSSKRQELRRLAMELAKSTKDQSIRGRAIYHALVQGYFLGGQAAAGNSLGKLAAGQAKLPAALKTRAVFLSSLVQANTGNTQAMARVNALAPSLGRAGIIAGRLAIAKTQAARKQPAYAASLTAATSRADGLSVRARQRILSYAVAVWQRGEGKASNQGRAPIALKPFADLPEGRAIIERTALADAAKGNLDQSIRKYQALSRAFAGTTTAAKLDRQGLDLEQARFKETKQIGRYESALANLADKYRDEGALGSGHEAETKAESAFVQSRQSQLTQALLRSSKAAGTASGFRMQAIGVATRYAAKTSNPAERATIMTDVAGLYTLEKRYQKAVEIYLELAQNHANDARRYRLLAIQAQAQLASWPAQAPWNGVGAGNQGARATLAEIYSAVVTGSEQVEWPLLAQLGLLKINIGQGQDAFKLWTEALGKSTATEHSRLALGLMLVSYDKAQKWTELEELAKLALSKGIRPMHRGKVLSPTGYLANALFNGGQTALAQNDFPLAVRRLEEFTKTFKTEARRDGGLYYLAQAHHGAKAFNEALVDLRSLSDEYPQSKHLRAGLLDGARWSEDMAAEEEQIVFAERFQRTFADDPASADIRKHLLALYQGRGLYGPAAKLYSAEMANTKLPAEQRLNAAIELLTLTARFGEKADALLAAQQVHKLAAPNAVAQALAYGVEARYAIQAGQQAEIVRIEKALAALDTSNSEVAESLALTRLAIAERTATKTKEEIFNLGLRDPAAMIGKHEAIFAATKRDFEAVCAVGATSSCGPAMFRLARVTTQSMQTIEDLTIPETLDAATVKHFQDSKERLIGVLAAVAQTADEKATKMVQAGQSTPTWTQQILWTTSQDWTFEPVAGELGLGYVQWTPSDATSAAAE